MNQPEDGRTRTAFTMQAVAAPTKLKSKRESARRQSHTRRIHNESGVSSCLRASRFTSIPLRAPLGFIRSVLFCLNLHILCLILFHSIFFLNQRFAPFAFVHVSIELLASLCEIQSRCLLQWRPSFKIPFSGYNFDCCNPTAPLFVAALST